MREITRSVEQYLQEWMNKEDFPVNPSDHIYRVYGLVDEDLDDMVTSIAETNGRELPTTISYWNRPILTVQDVVEFVATFKLKRRS